MCEEMSLDEMLALQEEEEARMREEEARMREEEEEEQLHLLREMEAKENWGATTEEEKVRRKVLTLL